MLSSLPCVEWQLAKMQVGRMVCEPCDKEQAMHEQKTTPDRLGAFSDAVLAVIITIMVLELKAPEEATFPTLLPLWPTAISYAVSYLFIAIIWLNHHHLLRFVSHTTPALIWVNFADTPQIPERARRMARRRSFATLTIFTSAMLVVLFAPGVGFALICCALIPYLTPEAPWLRALVRPSSRRSSSPGHGR
jgi:hypothetical protein